MGAICILLQPFGTIYVMPRHHSLFSTIKVPLRSSKFTGGANKKRKSKGLGNQWMKTWLTQNPNQNQKQNQNQSQRNCWHSSYKACPLFAYLKFGFSFLLSVLAANANSFWIYFEFCIMPLGRAGRYGRCERSGVGGTGPEYYWPAHKHLAESTFRKINASVKEPQNKTAKGKRRKGERCEK